MKKQNQLMDQDIRSHSIDILGANMHYLEAGQGNPIVLLHGVPTSSYLWRHVIPHLATLGRCIAPDLIGFGQSGKPDIAYSISDHIRYITQFIETLKLENITFVLHGWGSIIGLSYALHHENRCMGLVIYEGYLRPVDQNNISLPFHEQMSILREQEASLDLLNNGIDFVDRVVPQGLMQALSQDEMKHYRDPFSEAGSGKPLTQYISELPIGPTDRVNEIIADYSKWLMSSSLPKLLLYSLPGFITTIGTVMWAKEHLPSLEIVDIGEELHYAQESHPDNIGETISVWLQGIEQQQVSDHK
jgi:haloalkane dehalogenase